jgi:hypothetical protein
MANGDSKTQTIEFEGQTHEFPADFTQQDISKALASYGKPAAKPKEPNTGGSSLTAPNSIVGGAVRRGISAVKGAYETLKPPTPGDTTEQVAATVGGPGGLALERTAKGAYENVKQRAGQVASDVAGGHLGKAALHTVEMDPTSPVGPLSPTQSLVDEAEAGQYREALGGAAFDALTMLAGKKLGAEPSERAAASKLTVASGETGETYTNFRKVLPELKKTADQLGGRPQTVADVQKLVRDTTDRLSKEFDQDFAAIQRNRIYTPFIKNRLNKILADNPQWAKTPEGLAKRAAVKDAINTYDRTGWTFNEMNKERSDLRQQIRTLYSKAPSDAHAAMKVNAEIAAKEAVADVMSETVNDWLSHATGKPKLYYDELRQKQAKLIDLEDALDKRVGDLHDKQATHEGLGPGGRFKFHAYASPSAHGVMRAHISGLHEAMSAGPEMSANAAARAAMRSSKHPIAAGAVMSLPIETLNQTHGTANPKKRSSVPAPPTP